jgi:alkaline phosphatase D
MRILSLLLALLCHYAAATPTPLNTILFGSCAHQDKDIPILQSVISHQPDLFVFLGDNIYGDTEDMQILAQKYQKLADKPLFQQLRQKTPIIAIWDDHDYGANDAGKEYPKKEASRQLMLDFWQEPKDSPRRQREDGIYTAYTYGPEGKRVQIIMPDLRWNRPSLSAVSKLEYITHRAPKKQGPYHIHKDPNASMLGERQWQWLEQQLKQPAEIRIIASSLQVLADFTGWEAWQNFPADLVRLVSVIKTQQINGVILISGDTHWGEVSYKHEGLDYPLWEVTSSGLTEKWKDVSPNKHRIGQYTHEVNFGAIAIDWEKPDPLISLALRDINGDIITQHQFRLSSLSPY